MKTGRDLSPAIARLLATQAVGTIEYYQQYVTFQFANGRTGYIMTSEDGKFDSAMLYRGENCLGHFSTLKSLARVAA